MSSTNRAAYDPPRLRRLGQPAIRPLPEFAEHFDWILDVGGGVGFVLAAILYAHPDLCGRVLDLPPTATAAADRFAAAGLDDRASAVAGSFFEALPVGADTYLLSDILHDWDDDHARKILAGCRRAAAPERHRGGDRAGAGAGGCQSGHLALTACQRERRSG